MMNVGLVTNGLGSVIEYFSNGFTVRYWKAQKRIVKRNASDLDSMTREIINKGLDIIRKSREGDEWKDQAEDDEVCINYRKRNNDTSERYVLTNVAVVCKDEPELFSAIKDAIIAKSEIERLLNNGDLEGCHH